jgi:hypothetical protein
MARTAGRVAPRTRPIGRDVLFDDERVVVNAGIVLAVALGRRLGIEARRRGGQALARARRAGAGTGKARLAIDIDSFVAEVHGHAKQGAGNGHTGKLGYHQLAGHRADTSEVLYVRLRRSAGSGIQSGAVRADPS